MIKRGIEIVQSGIEIVKKNGIIGLIVQEYNPKELTTNEREAVASAPTIRSLKGRMGIASDSLYEERQRKLNDRKGSLNY